MLRRNSGQRSALERVVRGIIFSEFSGSHDEKYEDTASNIKALMQAPLKRRWTSIRLHGVTSQTTAILDFLIWDYEFEVREMLKIGIHVSGNTDTFKATAPHILKKSWTR
jgi:hypothetical protein